MKQQLWKLGLIGVLATASLTGCMTRQGTDANDRIQTNNIRPYNAPYANRWDNQRGANALHNNTRMEMSEDIASRIAALPEVDRAYVLLTDRNAYVAIALADRNNGFNNANGRMNRDMDRQSPFRTPEFAPQPNRAGNGTIFDNGNGDNGIGIGNGALGNGNALGDRNAAGNGRNGLGMTGPNRLGADDVNNPLRTRIASIVQSMHPVSNVYVSANPGFVDRLNGYAQRLRNGQPVRGMVVEFNTMVERMFPDRVGTDRGMIPSPAPLGNINGR